MIRPIALFLSILSLMSVFAAPAAKGQKSDPVAPGFVDWQIPGPLDPARRPLTPSDLRHRYTIVIEIQGEKFFDHIDAAGTILSYFPQPIGGLAMTVENWFIFKYPRQAYVVVSNRGGKIPATEMKRVMKDKVDFNEHYGVSNFRSSDIPLVDGLTFEGAPDAGGKYPFIYVMGPEGKDPVWQGTVSNSKECIKAGAEIYKLFKDKTAWTRFLGPLTEPVVFKAQFNKAISSGKGFGSLLPVLKKGIASKDEATSKEAQIIYDAIIQDRNDLCARIRYESKYSPAAGIAHAREFLKLYPQDKKLIAEAQARYAGVSEYEELATIFSKLQEWEDESFLCKNAGEAKKNVQQLEKWKKRILSVIEDTNNPSKQKWFTIYIQNAAYQLQPKVDAMIELMPSKVK